MLNDTTYYNIQYWMVSRLGLKGTDLLVYAIIHGFSQDGTSFCYTPLEYMTKMTGVTKKAVIDAIKRLENKNLIIKKKVTQYTRQTSSGGIRTVKARGAQYFSVYYTTESRKNKIENPGDQDPKDTTPDTPSDTSYTDKQLAENAKNEAEAAGFRVTKLHPKNDTPEDKSEFRVTKGYPYGCRKVTRTGIETTPNTNDTNNNTTTPTNTNQNKKINIEAEAALLQKITNLFGGNVFSADLIPVLSVLSTDQTKLTEYLEWLHAYCVQAKPHNFISLFYTLAKKPHMYQQFLTEHAKKIQVNKPAPKQHEPITECPVCHTPIGSSEDRECSHCHFDFRFANDIEERILHTKLYTTLGVEKLTAYLQESKALVERFREIKDLKFFLEETTVLQKKYGISYKKTTA